MVYTCNHPFQNHNSIKIFIKASSPPPPKKKKAQNTSDRHNFETKMNFMHLNLHDKQNDYNLLKLSKRYQNNS